MNDKDLRDLRHFTTPFRAGNIIIGCMALCFLPMLLGIIFFALTNGLEALLGGK